ncbi:hypothetical protein NQ317_013906 [Molorchus minor]|uniref:Uncharacterized protein n=1 Tax=Molorchus minor TaxID=1323400 RepID=A0ABQ9K7J9_9CUCU|nr:hypothetical protein NQ317_013906 [Molorchus minor]
MGRFCVVSLIMAAKIFMEMPGGLKMPAIGLGTFQLRVTLDSTVAIHDCRIVLNYHRDNSPKSIPSVGLVHRADARWAKARWAISKFFKLKFKREI